MTNLEKHQLKTLLLKYQLIYFLIVFAFSLLIFYGYFQIQFLLAESLFKTNSSELLVQDYRAVVLNMDQFVPGQFSLIKLMKDNSIVFSIGRMDVDYLSFKSQFVTKDKLNLVFVSSYNLVATVIFLFLSLSVVLSRFINIYFTKMYSKQIADQIKLQKSETLNDLSKKVAHDIRSPLSTLNMLSSMIDNLEVRDMQQAVTRQIDKIANDLLNYARGENNLNQALEENIKNFFFQLKNEYEFKADRLNRKIVFQDKLLMDYGLSDLTLLYQNLNNFINNSVEATSPGDSIEIELTESDKFVIVRVRDFGCGIDEATLRKLGVEAISTKKASLDSGLISSGNGIAVMNAFKSLNNKGWKLDITSNLGKGTTVAVLIPKESIKLV